MISRVYTGPDGKSHFEDLEKPPGTGDNKPQKAQVMFQLRPPGFFQDFHTPAKTTYVITLTGSTVVMVPLALGTEGVPSLALTAPTWGAIGYYSVLATAGAYLLYYRVLAMAGAGNLLLCTLIIPPIAILLGVVFLGETLAPQTLAGFTLIAAGLAVIDGRLLRRRLTNP